MSVMIQIRNVPDHVHRTLKSRAALAGMSLSDYLLRQIRDVAERPTLEEALARIRTHEPVNPSVDVVDMIREIRDQP